MIRLLGIGFLLAGCLTAASAEPLRPRQGTLKVGDTAPGFELKDITGKKPTKLADLIGKPVVLIFGSCT